MPVLDSVLTDELGRDKIQENLRKAFRKPSVLRKPLVDCPDFSVPFHWMDGGNILDYPTTLETYVSANGFSDLTTINDGSNGVGFYIMENEILGIVSAVPFINHSILNFCINYEKSLEYDDFIVFTDYSVRKGAIPFINGQVRELQDTINDLVNSPVWGYMNPDQQGTIEFLRDSVLSANSAFDMTTIPAPVLNMPNFANKTPSEFYKTSSNYVPTPNVQRLPYVGLMASACPALIQTFGNEPICTMFTPVSGPSYPVYTVDMGNNPETTATMEYYTNEIEEVTGGAMPKTSKGLMGHLNDLLAALPAIIAGIMAINALLSMIAGLCEAFAQAIGSLLGVINGIVEAISNVIQEITNFINTMIATVTDYINRLTQAIVDGITSAINEITAQISKVINQVMDAVTEMMGQVMALVQQVFSKIMDEIKKIVEFFKNMIKDALAAIFGEGDSCLKALLEQVAAPAAIAAVSENATLSKVGIF